MARERFRPVARFCARSGALGLLASLAIAQGVVAQPAGGSDRDVIVAASRAMDACVVSQRPVRVTVRVRIGASGAVEQADASGSVSPAEILCVEQSARRLQFPARARAQTLSFPVHFAPQP